MVLFVLPWLPNIYKKINLTSSNWIETTERETDRKPSISDMLPTSTKSIVKILFDSHRFLGDQNLEVNHFERHFFLFTRKSGGKRGSQCGTRSLVGHPVIYNQRALDDIIITLDYSC